MSSAELGVEKGQCPCPFGILNCLSVIEPLNIDVGRDFRYFPSQLPMKFQDFANEGSEKEKDSSLGGIMPYSTLA